MRQRILIGLLSLSVCAANAALAQRIKPVARHFDCQSTSCTSDSECIPPNNQCTGCWGDRDGQNKKCGVIAQQLSE